ncbi:MAG: hypothetical protein IPJ47_12845 [Anaerolineales bacterium]|nr:hypothetical protein [Anaerolineales bacterium]
MGFTKSEMAFLLKKGLTSWAKFGSAAKPFWCKYTNHGRGETLKALMKNIICSGCSAKNWGYSPWCTVVATTVDEHRINLEQVCARETGGASIFAIDNARLYEEAQRELNERKAAEEALRSRSENRFRKVFNNGNIAISIVT